MELNGFPSKKEIEKNCHFLQFYPLDILFRVFMEWKERKRTQNCSSIVDLNGRFILFFKFNGARVEMILFKDAN